MNPYHSPAGGLPPQDALHTGRAVFTEAYAVIPRAVLSDITASLLPGWTDTRAWIIARPMSGFAESFAHYLMDIAPGGGSTAPEPDPKAQAALFVTGGLPALRLGPTTHALRPGSYAWLPPGADWALHATGSAPARLHWIRKRWEPAAGLLAPDPVLADDAETAAVPMPGTDGRWATTRFVEPGDLRHDMLVNIVTLQPGTRIPFEETHVMEHGLYVLQGRGVYRLNQDWVEVEAGDYIWLRAFCPQACYAAGPEPFRYLLYKDVNRHPTLAPLRR